jgi:hypothetical protein
MGNESIIFNFIELIKSCGENGQASKVPERLKLKGNQVAFYQNKKLFDVSNKVKFFKKGP